MIPPGLPTRTDRMVRGQIFDRESLRCTRQIGAELLASSRSVGWQSLLIDHHRIRPHDGEFVTHRTSDQTIVVMLAGEQRLETYSAGVWRPATYQAGTVGLTPGNKVERLRRRPSQRSDLFEKANLYIPTAVLAEVAEEHRRAGQPLCDVELNALAFSDPLLAQTAIALLHGIETGATNLYAEAASIWVATHLLAIHARRIDPGHYTPRPISDRRIARVLEMMSARLAEPLTLDELAAEAGISKFHFARQFKLSVGMAPHALLATLRFDAARTLLSGTDLAVGVIASRCGYARASQLNAVFAQRLGMAPLAWRRRQRG